MSDMDPMKFSEKLGMLVVTIIIVLAAAFTNDNVPLGPYGTFDRWMLFLCVIWLGYVMGKYTQAKLIHESFWTVNSLQSGGITQLDPVLTIKPQWGKTDISSIYEEMGVWEYGTSLPTFSTHHTMVVAPVSRQEAHSGHQLMYSKLRRYTGKAHFNLPPHILAELMELKSFKLCETILYFGEALDIGVAYWDKKDKEFRIHQHKADRNESAEESVNRNIHDLMLKKEHLQAELAKILGKGDDAMSTGWLPKPTED